MSSGETMIHHRHMFYDAEADALTLYTAQNYAGTPQTFSDPIGGILVDVVDGKIVSVEILAVSRGVFAALIPQVYGGTLTSFEFGSDSAHASAQVRGSSGEDQPIEPKDRIDHNE